jgi:nitrate/nitrite-specific signal transduction histidine kinase
MGEASFRSTQRSEAYHEILARSILQLTASFDLWKFVIDTISLSAEALQCHSASLFLFDKVTEQLRLAVAIEDGQPLDLFQDAGPPDLLSAFPADRWDLWREVCSQNKPCYQDIDACARLDQPWSIPWYRPLERKWLFGIPLSVSRQPIGISCLAFGENNLPEKGGGELTSILSQQIGVAIQALRAGSRGVEAKALRQELVTLKRGHEQLAQCLATISLYLAAAGSQGSRNPRIVTDALDKAQELSQYGMKLARETNAASTSGRSDREDLSAVLRALSLETEEETSIDIQFLEHGRPCEWVLPNTAQAVAGVVREVIDNGLRHGRATQIAITLCWYPDKLYIEVIDNGIGFDLKKVEQANEGYGISGMYEQARRIQGQLELHSSPGKGTRIQFSIPMVNL